MQQAQEQISEGAWISQISPQSLESQTSLSRKKQSPKKGNWKSQCEAASRTEIGSQKQWCCNQTQKASSKEETPAATPNHQHIQVRTPELWDDNILNLLKTQPGIKINLEFSTSSRSLTKFNQEGETAENPLLPHSLPTLAVCPSSMESFFPAAASQICTKPLWVPTATKFPWTKREPGSVQPETESWGKDLTASRILPSHMLFPTERPRQPVWNIFIVTFYCQELKKQTGSFSLPLLLAMPQDPQGTRDCFLSPLF